MSEELRKAFRLKIHAEIMGHGWRPDKPLENLSPGLERVINGAVDDMSEYRQITGEYKGLRRALELFDEAFRELYVVTEENLKA